LYALSASQKVFFSCGNKTFTGFALPYNGMKKNTDEKNEEDPFLQEKDFFFKEKSLAQSFPIQKEGFSSWKKVQGIDTTLDNGNFRIPNNLQALVKQKLCDSTTGLIKISPTHLNRFLECPRKYIFERILWLKNIDLKVSLLDKTFIGIFFHEILHRFFENLIQNDSGYLHSQKNDIYIEEIKQIAYEVLDAYPESCGERDATRLTKEILIAQKEFFIDTILQASKKFVLYFDGFKVLHTEKEFTKKLSAQFELLGKIDVLLLSPDDELVLVDFKTNTLPKNKEVLWKGISEPKNFQIACYVSLLENHFKTEVLGAGFFSIKEKKIQSVMGSFDIKKGFSSSDAGKKSAGSCRHHDEEAKSFEKTLESFDSAIQKYMDFIENPNLENCPPPSYATCHACSYKTICRSNFIIGKAPQWGDLS